MTRKSIAARLPDEEPLDQYLAACRERVDAFTRAQFSWQGAWSLRKRPLAQDLLIAPLNVLLAFPSVIAKKGVTFFERGGYLAAARFLARVPTGVKTGYQREIETRVWSELFGLGPNVRSAPEREAALERILGDSVEQNRLHGLMESQLQEFFFRRAYFQDLVSSLTTWFVAWMLYRDSSLGIWDIGSRIARERARDRASSSFFLGKDLGNAFYGVVGVEPSGSEVLIASLATLLFLTAVAVLVSYASEPLQLALGIQPRQLSILIDSLGERNFTSSRTENSHGNAAERSSR